MGVRVSTASANVVSLEYVLQTASGLEVNKCMEPSLSPNAILWQLDDTSKVKHIAPVELVCKNIKISIATLTLKNLIC
jgi:hypothetical protein